MLAPEDHPRENERLEELASYSIMDTLHEEEYDNLTAIAAEICGTRISLVSLLDEDRQWFKSHHGLAPRETPREFAFCGHAIHHPGEVFIVHDAREDERFHDNPLVTDDPYVIFYAGFPLISEGGLPMGTLCVIDKEPKLLNSGQIESLRALSKQVMKLMELRKKNRLLERSVKELEQKSKDLERFATVTAHDIKSPLNNISGLAEALIEDYASEIDTYGKNLLQMIGSSAEKLKLLVNGLLEHSKSESISLRKKSSVSIKNLFEGIKGLFTAGDYDISLITEVDVIEINALALERILVNLISNAIKYNDKEKPQVAISLLVREKQYVFGVKDNGPGIPARHEHKIFDIFEVLSEQDRFGRSGTGIGLASVKRIVESLGGSIRLEPNSGQGANFTFEIPR